MTQATWNGEERRVPMDIHEARSALAATSRSLDRISDMLARHFRLGMAAIVVAVMLGGAVVFMLTTALGNQSTLLDVQDELIHCTQPGPNKPSPADPNTGHACYDRGQAATAKAVAAIVDANANGTADTAEILVILQANAERAKQLLEQTRR